MRNITDLAIFIQCVSWVITAGGDRPGRINLGVLTKCKGHGVSHCFFFVQQTCPRWLIRSSWLCLGLSPMANMRYLYIILESSRRFPVRELLLRLQLSRALWL